MQPKPRSPLVRFAVLSLIFFLLAGCGPEKPVPPSGPAPLSLPPLKLEPFAEIPPLTPLSVTPAFKEQIPDAERAANYKQVMGFLGVRLNADQKKFLNDQKFLLIPKSATRFKGKLTFEGCTPGYQWDEMLGLFDAICGKSTAVTDRRPENARLVTPDVVLHAFHKYVENSLEYLETTELAGLLRRFLKQAQTLALEYKGKSQGPLAARYEIIAAQLTVPLIIMENAGWPAAKGPEERGTTGTAPETPAYQDSPEAALKLLDRYQSGFSADLFDQMAAELRHIYQAREVTNSPLYGRYGREGMLKTDYTQFTPRSHYVKSSILRAYFRAMIYLGRNSYLLNHPEGIGDALLLAHLLAGPAASGRPLLKDWQKIMEITSFYAGVPDDLSYPEWRDFIAKVLGTDKFSPGDAVNPEVLKKIAAHLPELKGPRILSDVVIGAGVPSLTKEQLLESTKAFRIFGQRFTFDAWILNRLTGGEEKTGIRLPSTPSALFIPGVFGDQAAREAVGPFLEKDAPPFSPQEVSQFMSRLDEVAGDLAKVKETEWFSSLSTVWLKLLDTLTGTFGEGYPQYMQSARFPVKQLQTFLGSYTELKHDTLLYAKQSYAEMGDGEAPGKPPPVPKGLVEPNLPFWQDLGRLAAYTEAGFKKYGLFKDELEEFGRLTLFKGQVAFYTTLAQKELQGEAISEAEYEKLRTENLSYLAQPFDPSLVLEEKDLRSALIADIHTDALKQQVLYEATGEPYLMLALVGNDGPARLTIGVVFNHYEFTGPLAKRYTDADWQSLVYEAPARLPAKNFWYQGLLVK
ncbi:MAG: DUF3160 domain-containing protein [Thermodesulfobacteriota bacterium]